MKLIKRYIPVKSVKRNRKYVLILLLVLKVE